MTIRMPDSSISDKVLKCFGKKRGLILPKIINEQDVHSFYATAIKENFWKALFRSRNEQLPLNVIDYETFMKNFKGMRDL
ncbi:MAG: hypothetical protein K8S13_01300 [Desulfobacula sp.]|uniref:hypothetical protein n=1 Tax=Desulfobacula sp. TaxID=2593537 RepID=UPI0025C5D7D3|nr:hypothetical protein [Desulfobacula sp.]MCD4718484.1 hypothetical protein [Desulfobacula sp.]